MHSSAPYGPLSLFHPVSSRDPRGAAEHSDCPITSSRPSQFSPTARARPGRGRSGRASGRPAPTNHTASLYNQATGKPFCLRRCCPAHSSRPCRPDGVGSFDAGARGVRSVPGDAGFVSQSAPLWGRQPRSLRPIRSRTRAQRCRCVLSHAHFYARSVGTKGN